ncbi:hypothetical protein IJ103_03725 [Candidatus Saccharibacteria bacterium]|nr:hypothetical protein [Candidatus Saccharibacteria bacterium]
MPKVEGKFMSIHRVYRRMGQIDDSDYAAIAKSLHEILFSDKNNISSLATGVCGRENPEYDSIISNHSVSVNSKNVSSLATGVCGRENPEYDSIISNQTRPVKTLIRKLQKLFRKRSAK